MYAPIHSMSTWTILQKVSGNSVERFRGVAMTNYFSTCSTFNFGNITKNKRGITYKKIWIYSEFPANMRNYTPCTS